MNIIRDRSGSEAKETWLNNVQARYAMRRAGRLTDSMYPIEQSGRVVDLHLRPFVLDRRDVRGRVHATSASGGKGNKSSSTPIGRQEASKDREP